MQVRLVRGLAALSLLAPFAAKAADIHVPADQPTIQEAIAAARNGDVVRVAPGTYLENLEFLGKAIVVESDGGPDVTIIDGGYADSVVRFVAGEGQDSVLRGFTIRHGHAQFSGGGILISSASPTVEGNHVVENEGCDAPGMSVEFSSAKVRGNLIARNHRSGCTGGVGGGGVSVLGAGSAEISGNVIEDNEMYADGGGITLWAAGTPLIANNVIRNNRASGTGGGIVMYNCSDADVVQNVIVGNSAYAGGGIAWLVPSGCRGPLLVNNTISDNAANVGAAVFSQGFTEHVVLVNNILAASAGAAVHCDLMYSSLTPAFQHTVVLAPSAAPYEGCPDPTGTDGNIEAEPLFGGPAAGDYRTAPGSPCVDAGLSSAPLLPAQDIGGAPRVSGAAVDVGAYEYSGPPLAVSPTHVAFPNQIAGSTGAPVPVTLTNPGAIEVNVTGVTATADFAVATTTCGGALAAGASCAAQVAFQPVSFGPRLGDLAFTVAGASSPLAVRLSGTAAPLAISISPVSIAFGDQMVEYASSAIPVLVSNPNATALSLGSIGLSGSNAADFAESHDCPASLAAGASCTISVSCTPSAFGYRQASISIASLDLPAPAVVSLTCQGIAAVAAVSLDPPYGNVEAGDTASYQLRLQRIGPLADPLSFSCAIDAPSSSCSVEPGSVDAGTGVRYATVSVRTTGGRQWAPGALAPDQGMRAAVLLLGSALILLGRRRARVFATLMLAAILSTSGLGCASSHERPTPQGTYTLTVTVNAPASTQTVSGTLSVW